MDSKANNKSEVKVQSHKIHLQMIASNHQQINSGHKKQEQLAKATTMVPANMERLAQMNVAYNSHKAVNNDDMQDNI